MDLQWSWLFLGLLKPHPTALNRRRLQRMLVVAPGCGLTLQAASAAGLTNRAIVLAALATSHAITQTKHRNPIPPVTRASSSAAHVAPG